MGSKPKLTDEERQELNRRKTKLVKYKLKLKNVEPITDNQDIAYSCFFGTDNQLLLHGVAGTGKTFLSMYFALSELAQGLVDTIIIVRSTVQTRDMGFMPGSEEEKLAYYEGPYKQICNELCEDNSAYNKLKEQKAVRFTSTAFMRGVTLDNCIVIMDEVQNMNFQEIDTVLTRIGENSRVIMCGDFRQDDLRIVGKRSDKSGIQNLMKISKKLSSIDLIEFKICDIVRSGFVKEYIMVKEHLKLED